MPITRNRQDLVLTEVKALPAAAATANGDALDLDSVTLQGTVAVLQLTVPATPSLVDTKTIIYTVEDSADSSSWAAVSACGTKTSTGAGGAGAAAISDHRWTLPESTRRYVRVTAAVLTAGGDNTAISYTYKILV